MNAYQEFRMIGSRPIRPDGLDKVTGRALRSGLEYAGADLRACGEKAPCPRRDSVDRLQQGTRHGGCTCGNDRR